MTIKQEYRSAMSSRVEDYFESTVKPTVAEFMAAPYDIRLGRVSAIVLHHMTDYWALEGYTDHDRKEMRKFVDEVRKELCNEYPDYLFVADVADASKHAKLALTKNGLREVSSADQITRSDGLFEVPFGEGYFSEACVVFAKLENGSCKPLNEAIGVVMAIWKIKLEALP
jgi:hypothetical protein